MIGFETKLVVPLPARVKERLEYVVKKHPELYNTPAHAARCAIIRLLRGHQ